MRSYITENKTWPIFPSWPFGSSMQIKDFFNAIRIPGATAGVTPISWFSGCPLPDGHASRLPLRGRRRVSGGAQESRLGRGGRERHWLARDTAWSSPTICAPSRTEPFGRRSQSEACVLHTWIGRFSDRTLSYPGPPERRLPCNGRACAALDCPSVMGRQTGCRLFGDGFARLQRAGL